MRSLRKLTLGLVAVSTVGIGACAINPVSGWPELVFVSEATEIRLGEEEAERVRTEMGLATNPELQTYVDTIGARLAEYSPRQDLEYRFHVVDSEVVNAFALPGGDVYVTRGLLARMNSEDELANVMGHEVGHVAARHAVQRITRAAPLALATGIPAAVVGVVLPRVGETIGSIGSGANYLFNLAPYGRAQESEADRVGQALAAKSGWDPMGMADFMHTLQREEELAGEDGPPWFVRTHPLSEERVEKGTAFARSLDPAPRNPVAPTHTAFLGKIEGLLVGLDPAEGEIRDDGAFLHADLDLWIQLPQGWKTHNAREFVAAAPDVENASAKIIVTLEGEGDDPIPLARAFAQGPGAEFGLLPKATRLGRNQGARAVGRSGRGTLDVSWVAHGGHIFQISGVCRNSEYDDYQTPFIDVALSLRGLTRDERSNIREDRLRLVKARSGEGFAELVERAEGTWSPEQTAVANGAEPDGRPQANQLVKVPVSQRYPGR